MLQVSSGKGGSNKDVIMVDPVEAKRLAAKQMEKIKAREKIKVNEIFYLDLYIVYQLDLFFICQTLVDLWRSGMFFSHTYKNWESN